MLSKEAINSAMQLSEGLDSRLIYVTATPNTPLAALVGASRVNNNFISDQGGVPEILVEDIVFMANNPNEATGMSDHDAVCDEIAKVGIEAVQKHINVARTIVAPLIDDLVTRTVAIVGNSTASSLLGMEIIVAEPSLPFVNPALARMVEDFQEIPFDDPKLLMRIPSKTYSEILEYMKTGNGTFDKDVAAWAAVKGESFLLEVWEKIFTQSPVSLNAAPFTFRGLLEDRDVGNDRALAVFLLARRLIDEVPDGVQLPSVAYNNIMADFRNQAGKILCHAIATMARDTAAGMLVQKYDGKKMWVNAGVYSKWIADGGSNEILYGNMISSTVQSSVANINDNAEAYLSAWKKHEAYIMATERNRRYIKLKDVLRDVFNKQLLEAAADDILAIGGVEAVLRKFDSELDQVTNQDLENLYLVACRLICRTRFYKTSAERILLGIDTYVKDNPGLSVREAAAMSILEYICDWVSSMYTVKAIA